MISKESLQRIRQEVKGHEAFVATITGFFLITVSFLWMGWWDLLLLMLVLYVTGIWIHGSARLFFMYPSWSNRPPLVETLTLLVDVSKIARKNILAIEDALSALENVYLRGGLRMVVDHMNRGLIQQIMSTERQQRNEEAANEVRRYRRFAHRTMVMSAIFWGFRTTLDMEAGWFTYAHLPLFGVFTWACFWWLADYFDEIGEEQQRLREMIEVGVLAIEERERPDFIERRLLSYLSKEECEMYQLLQAELQNEEPHPSGASEPTDPTKTPNQTIPFLITSEQFNKFEDLLRIPPDQMQIVLKVVTETDLVLALKNTSEDVKIMVFGSMSSRRATRIREDLEGMGPVFMKDVEAAQTRIVQTVKQLIEDSDQVGTHVT